MTIRVTVAGASGRMGRTLIRAVSEAADMRLAAALESPGHPDLGKDSGVLAGLGDNGVALSDDSLAALAASDALLDFTTPAASVALADLAAQARIVHVIGTTGFTEADLARLKAASRHAVIVKSGNMSLGVNLLAALVKKRQGSAQLRRRDRRDASPHESGRALGHGADSGRGRGGGARHRARRPRRARPRRPHGPARAHRFRSAAAIGDPAVAFAASSTSPAALAGGKESCDDGDARRGPPIVEERWRIDLTHARGEVVRPDRDHRMIFARWELNRERRRGAVPSRPWREWGHRHGHHAE